MDKYSLWSSFLDSQSDHNLLLAWQGFATVLPVTQQSHNTTSAASDAEALVTAAERQVETHFEAVLESIMKALIEIAVDEQLIIDKEACIRAEDILKNEVCH
jgi:hypothetical protein